MECVLNKLTKNQYNYSLALMEGNAVHDEQQENGKQISPEPFASDCFISRKIRDKLLQNQKLRLNYLNRSLVSSLCSE